MLSAAIAATALAGCHKASDRASTIAALKADAVQWQADIQRRDARAYAARYASDGTLFDAGQPPVPGAIAMRAIMEGAFKSDFTTSLTPEKIDASDDGSMGYVQGRFSQSYTPQPGASRVTERGHYVTVYRRQADGSLKVVQDIGTPSPGA
jgi:ketosteroid isomerase-like protein